MDLDLYQPYWQVVGATDGAWRIQFHQDFPDFDSNRLSIDAKHDVNDSWENITLSCDVFGDRITTPYTVKETLIWARIYYGGHTSNTTNNLYNFLVVDSNLSVTVANNQVDAVVVSFTNNLGESFDASKISVGYSDPGHSRTYSGSDVAVTQDEEGNCTATIHVGNQILGTSMTVYATLKYDGSSVTTVSRTVTRT